MKPITKLITLAAATCLSGGLAAAQTGPAEPPHLCSGIGEDNREAAEAFPYSVKFIFAGPEGEYLGDVSTTIAKDGQSVLVAVCDGPWLLAALPSGAYEVDVFHGGQIKRFELQIDGETSVEQVVTF